MRITSVASSPRLLDALLIALIVLAPVGVTHAAQAVAPPIVMPQRTAAPNTQFQQIQFQQVVQQQQVRDQLQKSQLQQQLQQSVSDNAKRPGANDPLLQRQLDQSDRARHDRDRAALQDLLDRYQSRAALPRVIPQAAPASSRSGG